MKTNRELLDFYMVEIGDTYRVTGVCDTSFRKYYGELFRVYKNSHNNELRIRFNDNISLNDQPIAALNNYGYRLCSEDILDEKEKEYLAAVIKPFRSKHTIRIVKLTFRNGDRIYILMDDAEGNGSDIALPMFSKGTMYKGMKLNRHYTPIELGL